MRDAQRYRSICFGVHFTSSVGWVLWVPAEQEFRRRSSIQTLKLFSKLEHLRMGAGKPASFTNNQSLVILKFSAKLRSRRRCNGEAIDLGRLAVLCLVCDLRRRLRLRRPSMEAFSGP